MDRVLIVSGSDNATAAIAGLIREAFPNCSQSVISNGSEARRAAAEKTYDAVIINCPLKDEFGNDLAEHITATTNASCVMIVRAENCEQVGERMEDLGVIVIAKPLSKQIFYQSLKFINASRKRLLGLQNENIKLHKRLEEMRTINRAKFALMQYLNFTETQAHRYLEKQAMDMRCTKLEVALSVLKTYEP